MAATKTRVFLAPAAGAALLAALAVAPVMTQAQAPRPDPCGGRSLTPQVACQEDVDKMMAALPDKAPAKPQKARTVLVLGHATGWVHSSIPLAAKTVAALGEKTGAWKTVITYDAADVNTANLKQYDALILDSTTGCFLDDPNDKAATDARRAALLAFIRGGKGIVGLHAASDSYHGTSCTPPPPGAGRGGDGPRANDPLWPEWNTLIGGYFKFHWNDPQLITVKIDDPKSPLTAMFHGQPFEIHDETYTFWQGSFSRKNVHVLTSVDYDKMSAEDKAKEPAASARTDHDYALSWIRREGKGRLFYEAHLHHERNYAVRPMLEHILAGIQYAIGDLKAPDGPSVK